MDFTLVSLAVVLLALVLVTAYTSVQVVDDGELEALYVFGRMEGVLEPGRNIVPPLVSKTYPIDPRTEKINRGNELIEIPSEFEAAVREAAAEDGSTSSASSDAAPIYQKGITLIRKGMFLVGAIGFILTVSKFGNLIGSSRGDVSWPFLEPTFAHLAVTATISILLMFMGDPIEGRNETRENTGEK